MRMEFKDWYLCYKCEQICFSHKINSENDQHNRRIRICGSEHGTGVDKKYYQDVVTIPLEWDDNTPLKDDIPPEEFLGKLTDLLISKGTDIYTKTFIRDYLKQANLLGGSNENKVI